MIRVYPRWMPASAAVLLAAALLASGCAVRPPSATRGAQEGRSGSGAPAQAGAYIQFIRSRALEGGAVVERVDLWIYGDGRARVEAAFQRPGYGPEPSAEVREAEFQLSAAEVERLFNLIERSGLAELPRADVDPGCETVYSVSWLRPNAPSGGAGVSLCAKDAPLGAAPLLEALNRLADEGVRKANGDAK